MTFRVIKPFLVGSIAIVHESNGTMLIVKENEVKALQEVLSITGERVAPAMMENADELQTEKAEER